MKFKRASGIILHPTSLPGPDGIGDLGPEVYRWIDFLSAAGCSLWQILPLGPTGYGDSPYQCFSAFAGNPLMISPALLLEDGLLNRNDLANRPDFPENRVDYGQVISRKLPLLDQAFFNFQKSKDLDLCNEYNAFQENQAFWLEDFSTFMAIKEEYGGGSWNEWPEGLRMREPNSLAQFQKSNIDSIQRHCFRQFLFFRQWQTIHQYANKKSIQIIGDIPIFVAFDSAETWSHPELFQLNEKRLPTVVAGVPPDYFSPTGQLWGNPHYRWSVHKATGYDWWIKRIKTTLQSVDIIRLDHFRGFAGYWEVSAKKTTAESGKWAPGPGHSFFDAVQKELGGLPIIAEDLGKITPDVVELRQRYDLPGMKILQFAFSTDSDDPFLPHNYPVNCVAYTGTHDNDTTMGWYQTAPEKERDFCRRYLARSGNDISWDMIRGIWSSVAVLTLAPIQDFLSLSSEARMNFPGKPGGNWTWRIAPNALNEGLKSRIREANYLYGRLPEHGESSKILQGHI
ncbi:MAG TPA: 4-alpha-glucanotransferase [Anaerolineaceae bacterium]|nr:4-alpha-glucanotransferase [Anaerolineaceae bacterium]